MLYEHAKLLFIRALTSIHVGIGRTEGYHVDLPIQRDEFGYPTIWASSLKGAVKANISVNQVKKYLGSEPDEKETYPSSISITDAKLLMIPGRVLEGVWTYVTTTQLLENLEKYVNIYNEVNKTNPLNLSILKPTGNAKYTRLGRIFVNEYELEVDAKDTLPSNFLDQSGLKSILPNEIVSNITSRGLLIVSEANNLGLNLVNKSILIQYRVRLKRGEKTVETGPWSEEYLPMETVFVSLVLCRDFKDKEKNITISPMDVCKEFTSTLNGKSLYLGGKETIGRGLVKIYLMG
jgi:CRISPR-associated protein Cmr4